MFTSVIRLLRSATSSSEGLNLCWELRIRIMTKHSLVARLPPYEVVDLFYEVVSSVAKLNFWASAFEAEYTSIGL
jgi:hypothetical protein